jgi:hypothetical protein
MIVKNCMSADQLAVGDAPQGRVNIAAFARLTR